MDKNPASLIPGENTGVKWTGEIRGRVNFSFEAGGLAQINSRIGKVYFTFLKINVLVSGADK